MRIFDPYRHVYQLAQEIHEQNYYTRDTCSDVRKVASLIVPIRDGLVECAPGRMVGRDFGGKPRGDT